MTASEWRGFLKRYSEELLRIEDQRISVPTEGRAAGWMGHDPASPEAIVLTEQRLGRRLPESLRTFYGVSNGWRATGYFIRDVFRLNGSDGWPNASRICTGWPARMRATTARSNATQMVRAIASTSWTKGHG